MDLLPFGLIVVGLTVVAFGTSSPELAIAIGSALAGERVRVLAGGGRIAARHRAEVAEPADAADLNSAGREPMGVRISPSAPRRLSNGPGGTIATQRSVS